MAQKSNGIRENNDSSHASKYINFSNIHITKGETTSILKLTPND